MNITELAKQSMQEVASNLKTRVIPVKMFGNEYLYKVGKYNYYKNNVVHPEFYNLMHVPWALSASITFENEAVRCSKSERTRRKVINGLLQLVNARINRRAPLLESGRHTVRAAWVVEYAHNLLENERHAHILLHFHRATPIQEVFESYAALSRMTNKELSALGIATMDVQAILGQQADCVSYFCKIQWGREFKTFDYSPGFFPIVKRLFLPAGDTGPMKIAA